MARNNMRKIRLLFSRTDKDSVLRELMLLGCVDISAPEKLPETPAPAPHDGRDDDGLDRCLSGQQLLIKSLGILDKYVPGKKVRLKYGKKIPKDRLLDDSETELCLDLAKMIGMLDIKMQELQIQENQEKSLVESLEPWAPLQLPLDFKGTGAAETILGTVETPVSFEKLQKSLDEIVQSCRVFIISTNRKRRFICIIYQKNKRQEVSEILQNCDFTPATLKDLSGTAEDNIIKSRSRMSRLAGDKEELINKLSAAAKHRKTLQLCYDHISTIIARAKAAEKLHASQYTYLLTGWVTASSESLLASNLSKYDCAWDIKLPSPDEVDHVPVKYRNRLSAFIGKLSGSGGRQFDPLRISAKYTSV